MRQTLLLQHSPFLRRLTSSILATTLLLNVVSCKAATQPEGQKHFGIDADYFIGLKLLQEGNQNAARTKFNRCIKKGSPYCARKSAEAICSIGSIQEKNASAEYLLKNFPGEDSLLIASKQFAASGEINKLIYYTSDLDFSKTKDEIIRLRLEAMGNRGDSAYESEVYRWFTECPISTEHYQFYRDFYKHPNFEGLFSNDDSQILENLKFTPEQFAIHYRIESYKRNYSYTTHYTPILISYFVNGTLKPVPQLVSDCGKNYLYGSNDFTKNAELFEKLASGFAGTSSEFYFRFYAGRFYEKAGLYFKKSCSCFESAMQVARTPEQKDNALWYLLNTSLNFSMDSIINSIGEYSRQWNDSEYFEDFFEKLVSALLAAGRWNEFEKIYKAIDGYASDSTTAQYARLIQEGLVKGSEKDITNAFKRACNGGSSVYYKTLAAYRLSLWKDPVEIKKILCAPTSAHKNTNKEEAIDSNLETLFLGYTYFGFPELIYPEWQKTLGKNLSLETQFYLSEFLAKCAETDTSDNNDYYMQALRIAARAQRKSHRQLTKEELALVYPKNYKNLVTKYSNEFKIDENIMYALIRSESFFDADVMSTAGAIGLTQLMEYTASDIARHFKIQKYSLTDPETNIKFGTYYLSNLISRSENSALLGFFSYNTGITRVRRWQQSSLIEFGKKSNMPIDLFLETVPITETREYGRKLVSATIAYDWVSNPRNFEQCVKKLIE